MAIKLCAVTAAFMAAVSFRVYAQVEVIDLEVPSTQAGISETDNGYGSRTSKPGGPASMTEFYFQLQTLQQEVQTLRGLVEQQSYELKKLKQQRLDDYLDLDRRVSQLTLGSGAPSGTRATPNTQLPPVLPSESAPTPSDIPAEDTAVPSSGEGDEELTLYRSSIDAVLKQRDYDAGISLFNQYIERYPQGIYAANAKYWLGQVYLQRDDLEQSKKWFGDLIKNHPAHQKAPEAQFKLGKVLHLEGDIEGAKKLLKAVAVSNSAAAKLAQDYLNKNF
jgi:tol-pal system protein YbgF